MVKLEQGIEPPQPDLVRLVQPEVLRDFSGRDPRHLCWIASFRYVLNFLLGEPAEQPDEALGIHVAPPHKPGCRAIGGEARQSPSAAGLPVEV